jgi:uncharacterized protein (DUF1499 family)
MSKHWSRWLVCIQLCLLAIIFLAGLALRLDWVHFKPVFQLFKYAGMAALGVALLCLPVFIWGLLKRHADARRAAIWGTLLGVLPIAVLLFSVGRDNFKVPPIHDISTDTANPPAYQAVLSLRGKDHNSLEYGGEDLARQQLAAYPDIKPLPLKMPVAQATELAAAVAAEQGWRLVALDPQRGHLEAVVRTRLLGFTDDVVVRVTAEDGGSRVDVRSNSRVGVSDLGANAKRIRGFLVTLKTRAERDS